MFTKFLKRMQEFIETNENLEGRKLHHTFMQIDIQNFISFTLSFLLKIFWKLETTCSIRYLTDNSVKTNFFGLLAELWCIEADFLVHLQCLKNIYPVIHCSLIKLQIKTKFLLIELRFTWNTEYQSLFEKKRFFFL